MTHRYIQALLPMTTAAFFWLVMMIMHEFTDWSDRRRPFRIALFSTVDLADLMSFPL
jgi:hypothetical protein